MLSYTGYLGNVEFDADAKMLHGNVLGTRDVITFSADSATKIEKAFRDSIDDYLEFCAGRNEAPDKPASGRLLVRLPPALHRKNGQMAEANGKSINTFIREAIQEKRDQFFAALTQAPATKPARATKKRPPWVRR